MIVFLPILLLFVTPLVILGVRLIRPSFAYYWLIAVAGVTLAWPLVLLGKLRIPLELILAAGPSRPLFAGPLALRLDGVSWSFALALTTLTLAAILTDVLQTAPTSAPASSGSGLAKLLALSAVSLLAVFAGNLLTLLLAWAVLDLTELVIRLAETRDGQQQQRVVLGFAMRLAGLLAAVWAGVVHPAALPASLAALDPQVGSLLLLATAIRLGVLPVNLISPQELEASPSWRTISRLAPAAASLAILARAAPGLSSASAPVLLLLAALAALYGGLSWFSAADEIAGKPFWCIGMAALAVASAIAGKPAASQAFGLALLLPGSLLFLYSTRPRWLAPLLWGSALSLAALPFMPSWPEVELYAPPFQSWMLLFWIGQAFLLAGYIVHALRPSPPAERAERWIWIIYPWSLALLLLAYFAIAWWGGPGLGRPAPTLAQSWPAAVSLVLAGLLLLWKSRRKGPARLLARLESFLAFEWAYRRIGGLFSWLGRLLNFINFTLEGSAGLLWALLILILLASLFARAGLGG